MDHPQRNDRDWLKRTLMRWSDEDAELPEIDYEAIDITTMELPPGWRGYGARDQIDHPDTEARLADVESAEKQYADRYELQAALMPYEHLLPERYRARNERLEAPDDE